MTTRNTKLTIDEVESSLAAAGLERVGIFIKVNKPILCICLSCNHYTAPRLANIRRRGGGGCKPCSYIKIANSSMRLTIDQVDSDLTRLSLERVGSYINSVSPTLCVCLTCSRYVSPTLGGVRQGTTRCKYCSWAKNAKAQTLPVEQADTICLKKNLIRVGDYVNAHSPIEVNCLTCNTTFFPVISGLKAGGSCPSCAYFGFNPSKPAYFYVIQNEQWLKCGITNNLKERLAKHRRQGLTTALHNLYFESAHDAIAVEIKWRAYIKTFPVSDRATKSDIRDGFTETVRNFGIIRQWIDANLIS